MKKAKQPELKKTTLESTLAFLSLIHETVVPESMYAKMEYNSAVAYNRTLGAGTILEEDLIACPHIDLFEAAVRRCGGDYVITQLSPGKLLVRSGEFQAYIPCVDPKTLPECVPDVIQGILDDSFMVALDKVAPLAVTKGELLTDCSLLLGNGTVTATNGHLLMQAWHGHAFPNGLLIPKIAYTKLKKAKRRIVRFGFSKESLTLWFDDHSWLYTRLYQDKWPNLNNHLFTPENAHPVDPTFFEAVKRVLPFSNSGSIFVEGNLVSSHPFGAIEEGSNLSLPFEGAQFEPRIYLGADLQKIAKYVTKWDANARKDGTAFFGENLRGLISHGHFEGQGIFDGAPPENDEDIPF
jgi:hypothetical protein